MVVRTTCSGVSIGAERNLVRGEVDWGPFPICPGGRVVEEITPSEAPEFYDVFGVGEDPGAPGAAVRWR